MNLSEDLTNFKYKNFAIKSSSTTTVVGILQNIVGSIISEEIKSANKTEILSIEFTFLNPWFVGLGSTYKPWIRQCKHYRYLIVTLTQEVKHEFKN